MNIIKINKNFLNKEEILNKITEYDIYRYYFGDFKIHGRSLNHLRNDKGNPSFIIGYENGKMYHVDFANSYWRGSCFDLVMQIYNCDYNTALKIISKDFGLSEQKEIFQKKIITWNQPDAEEKQRAVIQVTPKKFTKLNFHYWASYECGESDLKNLGDVEIYSVKDLYINKEKVSVEDITFGFLFQGLYWKIYSPLSKTNKWRSNVPLDHMWGLNNIKGCKNSFVVKSVKDYVVWRKFISTCTAGAQNESKASISENNLEYLRKNSENCYIIFDNEEPGVNACKYYNDKGMKYWNVPKRYYEKLNIKDPSDLVHEYTGKTLQKEVKKKIIL